MKLSIITVTYNSQKYIKDYLDSLIKKLSPDWEIIIVDSASTDDTVEIVKKYPSVKLVEEKTNVGYGKGNNLAAKLAQGEFLLFLNPDTKIQKEAVEELLSYAESNSQVGIVAPKLVEPSGAIQPSVRRLPTIKGAIDEYYLGKKQSYEAYIPQGEEPIEVESVVGAVVLIKRSLFLKLEGFDKKYFMYFEDLDLCRKVRKAGFTIVYLPSAKVFHAVGGSINTLKLQWLKESAKKYHGLLTYFLLDTILRLRPQRNAK